MAFEISSIISMSLAGNSVEAYLVALSAFILSAVALRIFKYVVLKQLEKWAEKTKTKFDDLILKMVDNIRWPFFLVFSLYIALQFLVVPEFIMSGLYYAVFLVLLYYAVKGMQDIIDYTAKRIAEERSAGEKEADTTIIDLLARMTKGLLWIMALFLLLINLGYDITPLMAGLGIGGIAIAFALQNVLTDIFASFSIYFDKPFKIGDFIIIGKEMGTVKKIGIKSTRIQALQGEELIVSNKELTETRIHNFKRMSRRRIVFTFGVTYETPVDKLKKIPQIVKGIITRVELSDVDRVHFKEFGDSALMFEVVYFLNTSDYTKYMDTQQEINLAIKSEFEKEGIEMAYPTRTLYVHNVK